MQLACRLVLSAILRRMARSAPWASARSALGRAARGRTGRWGRPPSRGTAARGRAAARRTDTPAGRTAARRTEASAGHAPVFTMARHARVRQFSAGGDGVVSLLGPDGLIQLGGRLV